MMGEDHALPGTGCFQTTFLVLLHSSGSLPEPTMPWPVGPRNSGQFSALTGAALTTRAATNSNTRGFTVSSSPHIPQDSGLNDCYCSDAPRTAAHQNFVFRLHGARGRLRRITANDR